MESHISLISRVKLNLSGDLTYNNDSSLHDGLWRQRVQSDLNPVSPIKFWESQTHLPISPCPPIPVVQSVWILVFKVLRTHSAWFNTLVVRLWFLSLKNVPLWRKFGCSKDKVATWVIYLEAKPCLLSNLTDAPINYTSQGSDAADSRNWDYYYFPFNQIFALLDADWTDPKRFRIYLDKQELYSLKLSDTIYCSTTGI